LDAGILGINHTLSMEDPGSETVHDYPNMRILRQFIHECFSEECLRTLGSCQFLQDELHRTGNCICEDELEPYIDFWVAVGRIDVS
jgi:hypothetical protein